MSLVIGSKWGDTLGLCWLVSWLVYSLVTVVIQSASYLVSWLMAVDDAKVEVLASMCQVAKGWAPWSRQGTASLPSMWPFLRAEAEKAEKRFSSRHPWFGSTRRINDPVTLRWHLKSLVFFASNQQGNSLRSIKLYHHSSFAGWFRVDLWTIVIRHLDVRYNISTMGSWTSFPDHSHSS